MIWDADIPSLLCKAQPYYEGHGESDVVLTVRWKALMENYAGTWAKLVCQGPVFAESLDEEDVQEHDFLVGEAEGYIHQFLEEPQGQDVAEVDT